MFLFCRERYRFPSFREFNHHGCAYMNSLIFQVKGKRYRYRLYLHNYQRCLRGNGSALLVWSWEILYEVIMSNFSNHLNSWIQHQVEFIVFILKLNCLKRFGNQLQSSCVIFCLFICRHWFWLLAIAFFCLGSYSMIRWLRSLKHVFTYYTVCSSPHLTFQCNYRCSF